MNISEVGATLAYETMQYCNKNGPSVQLAELIQYLETNIISSLPGVKKFQTSYDSHTDPKWLTQLKFTLVDFDKAGWFKKSFPKRGYWTITDEGVEALKKHKTAEALAKEARHRYAYWKKQFRNSGQNADLLVEDELVAAFLGDDDDSLNEVIESADLKIKERLKKFDPYQFQNLVGALLVAMGYFVDFVAPKGKDGGIDLVCYQDPLGIKVPRMKIQVKHRPDSAVSRPTLSEFADQIKRDEIGIFVTTGTFSRDARQHAIHHEKHIRLIDGVEFVDLLKKHYSNLDQETKRILPLIEVFHLSN